MFDEHDLAILTRDIKEYGLTTGDIGTVVAVYNAMKAYEVEFVTAKGKTIAVLTLSSSNLRPVERNEMLHARQVVSA